MNYALNKQGEMVDIENSIVGHSYTCPVCGDVLLRKVGSKRSYFSHSINKENDCELKMSEMLIKKEKENVEYTISNSKSIQDLYNNIYNTIELEKGWTGEQVKIINNNSKVAVINAKAGASKTTCALEYAKLNKNKRIIYLTYNKSMADEAKESFKGMEHVACRTFHSIAYREMKAFNRKLTMEFSIFDIGKAIGKFFKEKEDFQLGEMIKDALTMYCTSEEMSAQEFIDNSYFPKWIGGYVEKAFNYFANDISKYITHDFYLKQWQLKKPNLSSLCDIIIIDEYNDMFSASHSIVLNSKVNTIVVLGDPAQSIYSWRGSKDFLSDFKGDQYTLNGSFRFGNTLAHLNKVVREFFTEEKFDLIGYNNNQRIVEAIDENKPYAYISRKNSTLMRHVFDNLDSGKKIYFEGNIDLKFIREVYDFYEGNNSILKFKSFESFYHFENVSREKKDFKSLSAIELVKTYKSDLPKKLDKLERNMVKDSSQADIILTTVHGAKGKTYTIQCMIANDLIDLMEMYEKKLSGDEEYNLENIIEELNIWYVANTRAKGDIQLNLSTLVFYENVINNTTGTSDKLISGMIKDLKKDMYNWKE